MTEDQKKEIWTKNRWVDNYIQRIEDYMALGDFEMVKLMIDKLYKITKGITS